MSRARVAPHPRAPCWAARPSRRGRRDRARRASATTFPPSPAVSAARLVVNIPAFRPTPRERVLVASYPSSRPAHRSHPTGAIAERLCNPWWHPPFNRRPKDKITPPGPGNPMGKVKLNFANLYYLHGTPKEKEIGSPASRGCVRLRNEDAVALAQLVHRFAVAPLPEGKLDELASTGRWRTQGYPVSNTECRSPSCQWSRCATASGVYRDFSTGTQPLAELGLSPSIGGVPRDQLAPRPRSGAGPPPPWCPPDPARQAGAARRVERACVPPPEAAGGGGASECGGDERRRRDPSCSPPGQRAVSDDLACKGCARTSRRARPGVPDSAGPRQRPPGVPRRWR